MGGMAGLSRPPSRVDNSRLDLSGEHAAASASNVKTLKEQEEMDDPDIQRAMAESLRQTLPAQENGVTQTGATFGPAKRDYNYEPNSWALTTYSTSREIIEHPPPSKRRRIGDAPAFLRGSKETGYLGSLLTIYHNIPLAREALLMPALRVHAYAHDSSWWSGATDENTKALSTDNSLRIDQNECNLLTEVQCLMAFLDKTTRAYGSVDALADLQAVRNANDETVFHKFLEAWGSAALKQAPQEQLTQVFSSIAMKANGPTDDTAVEKTLYCVDPFINHHPNETLTDLLDNTIWNDEIGTIDDVWISHCAEIFTVRLQEPNTASRTVDISLDPVWYADRYMYDCREEMQQIRRQVQAIRRQIEQLTHMQRRCQLFNSSNRPLDISEVLNAAVKASSVAASRNSVPNGFLISRLPGSETAVTQSDVDELNSELQNVLQRIRQRLALLEQKKDELRARSRQIAMQLTVPTPERPDVPHRKYTLQGVATKPGITYFRRLNQNIDLLAPDNLGEEGMGYEWWKATWRQEDVQCVSQPLHPPLVGPVTQAQAAGVGKSDPDSSTPWSIDRVFETHVLEAVKTEYNSVLLVYANENAVRFRGSGLSLALRHFVDRDNQAFAEDLQQEMGPLPASSADREAEAEFEDVPLIDPTRSSSSVRELTPMSTSSPDQDEDGQPTLRRAKEGSTGDLLEQPPSYEESVGKHEMSEKRENKIGLYAEKLLQRYGSETDKVAGEKDNTGDLLHLEESQ
ncbi:hypothetical protein A1O7_03591 [Cladophialophora yegresii CBS 114405]|uniref:Ubiquitin interaction motif protein n=1 Tax=Cladophialophora yegresii CBS 114405 TaxID=1182544 RepID=W9WEZ4_9EURO|nr:uncharacterized protein A1O7_03591 [Cladophialophora yegresii CBS 114405]EXJ63146.1 hypothetical protein A1O7_03591 [Cladophialophora yegresii CBS 114405]